MNQEKKEEIERAVKDSTRMVVGMLEILKNASQPEAASLFEATARVLFPSDSDQIKISIEERCPWHRQ